MINLEKVGEYQNESKAHVYVKAFKYLYSRELSDDDVRWWIESRSRSRTHNHIFLFVDSDGMA